MKICAFFGHRDAYDVNIRQLQSLIRTAVQEHGCTHFWCGGYGAFDRLAAQTLRGMKTEFPQIHLALVYAYLPAGKDERAGLYDETFLPEGLELVPRRFAISRRNNWIADHCDCAIACVSLASGGAYDAVKRIRRQHKPVWNLGTLPLDGDLGKSCFPTGQSGGRSCQTGRGGI